MKKPIYSEMLAEETGIHIGDGCLMHHLSVGKHHWCYCYCFHSEDDKGYGEYVKKLMKELYDLEPYERRQGNCTSFLYTKKNIVLYKQEFGLPIGKKEGIVIPSWIMDNHSYRIACTRGIFDTDGCVWLRKVGKYKYTNLKITSKSEPLIKQIKQIFDERAIKSTKYCEKGGKYRRPNDIWNIQIVSGENVKKYAKIFGFYNPKHQNKYEKYAGTGI